MGSYRSSAAIVTQMFVSLQARPGSNMNEFFKYENLRYPPSLSNKGKLRLGTKSQILDCFPGMPSHGKNSAAAKVSVVILDMPAVIHIVKPQKAKVFGEYLPTHLLPYMQSQINKYTTRIDAIWDCYPEGSLKNQTRAYGRSIRAENTCNRK